MVTCSIFLTLVHGFLNPPTITPLTLFDVDPWREFLAVIKSPKLVAFPAVAMVKNSMVLTLVGVLPPA